MRSSRSVGIVLRRFRRIVLSVRSSASEMAHDVRSLPSVRHVIFAPVTVD